MWSDNHWHASRTPRHWFGLALDAYSTGPRLCATKVVSLILLSTKGDQRWRRIGKFFVVKHVSLSGARGLEDQMMGEGRRGECEEGDDYHL